MKERDRGGRQKEREERKSVREIAENEREQKERNKQHLMLAVYFHISFTIRE